jgi:hypothetical protein
MSKDMYQGKLFRLDNTEGYSQEQLDTLNAEWKARFLVLGLEPGTEEYEDAAKAFCDAVARR